MLLKAAINGKRSRNEHPAIPINPSQQAHQAAIAVEAGAGAIHVHPRDENGHESLASDDLAAALQAIRAKCPTTPVGVSTGAWMVPDLDARIAFIEGWNVLPDFASVNFHEPGALKVFRVLADHGIAVEAGIWNLDAARLFCRSGLASRCLRILIEPAQEPGNAKRRLGEIEGMLQGVECPRLLHGFQALAWEFIALAADRGYATRVGLEDTLVLPDGNRAHDNRDLVTAARQIIDRSERGVLTPDSFFMPNIIGLSGSLRRASFNTMLLRAASQLVPAGATVEIGSIRGIPLYDGDVEAAEGIPQTVQELKSQIAAADGLLIVTPEYNNSIPGVLKNAIDWLSRPSEDIPKVFGGRPVALIGTTPGQAGTSLAQTAWLPVLRTLGTAPWFGGRMMVSDADEVFDSEGQMIDEKTKRRLEAFMKGFAAFISERRR